ncbi:hypothetical protein BJL95_20125 [Methylomonas sp. LWB]|uniref:hypothetical protein n=1 Tax=Methylomonas sp. LWB TaxID=1905845 RepID=UPI0008D968FB|nr:hypothetical protein [Methylomonas sp. LWB]OHX37002.1 hypothetical protein BJL95_20125 [Methylomonas sp. LWB]
MDLSLATAYCSSGSITAATIVEGPVSEGTYYVEFACPIEVEKSHSRWLETSRGNRKLFKNIQSALNDIKSIGLEKASILLGPEAFKRFDFSLNFPGMFLTKDARRLLSDDGKPLINKGAQPLDQMQAIVAALMYKYFDRLHADEIDALIWILGLCKDGSPIEGIFDEFIGWAKLYQRGTAASWIEEALIKPDGPTFLTKK